TTFYLDVSHNWGTVVPSPIPLAAGLTSWTYNTAVGTFPQIWDTPNIVYKAATYAKDNAGNSQVTVTTHTFTYDTLAPTATITYPANSGYVSQTGEVQGTVADNFQAGAVYVRISTNSFGSFWTGSSWTLTTNTWLTATLSPQATSW